MSFDKEKRLNKLFADFKRTDEFYISFKREFEELLFDIILDYHPNFIQKNVLHEIISLYATEVFSASESVIDKDHSYPEHRMIEELQYMDRLLTKEQAMAFDNDFSNTIHDKVKALVVKHYPNIINLSMHGFRLLERNLKLYLYGFISQFMSFVK